MPGISVVFPALFFVHHTEKRHKQFCDLLSVVPIKFTLNVVFRYSAPFIKSTKPLPPLAIFITVCSNLQCRIVDQFQLGTLQKPLLTSRSSDSLTHMYN